MNNTSCHKRAQGQGTSLWPLRGVGTRKMNNLVTKKIMPKAIGAYLNTMSYVAPGRVGEIGFNIFCSPISPPLKAHHRQWLGTARQFGFESDGARLQGYRWGSGKKKVFFLHGWQSHSYRWKKYVEAFSGEDYSLYAFDAPAHGLSKGRYANIPLYSNAIEAFFGQVGQADVVVSHSMGSISMLHALYNCPHLEVGRLVLMGSPGEANDFIEFYQKLTGLSDRTFKFIIDYFVKTLHHDPAYYSAPVFATGAKIPGLIIHDEGDEEAPYRHAVRIHQAWPQSKLVTTRGYGHNLRVPEVVDMVKEFVMKGELQNA